MQNLAVCSNKKILKFLLENTDLLKISSEYKPSEDAMMRDFHDGRFCRDNVLLSSHQTLKIILYINDFEVCNPLGAKATLHKLGAVYFTIASIPPKYRSCLNNMFLLMLFNSGDAKLYGYPQIFREFIDDNKSLEIEGLEVIRGAFK